MTIEYAGSLFDNAHDATQAAVYDWCTACGIEDAHDAAEAIEADMEWHISDLIKSGWNIPYVDMTDREELRELLEDFIQAHQ